MSRYGWSRSPYSAQSGGTSTVTKDGYGYVTSQDPNYVGLAPAGSRQRQNGSNPGDDVLLFECRGVTYPTNFPAYSIDDGKLRVSDVVARAGLVMDLPERKTRSLRFLFNGHQLKNLSTPVREYGVRNGSVIMAIIPEDDGHRRGDDSDEEIVIVREETGGSTKKKKRKSKRGGKGGKSGARSSAEDDSTSQRDSSSHADSKSLAPAPGTAGRHMINELSEEFSTTLLPLCEDYIASPPEDASKRKEEHTKLSETVMQKILLKLDEVDSEGNQEVRQSRRDLVKTIQAVLKQLDVACGPVGDDI